MAVPSTDPGRYGWRWWGVTADGFLVSPYTGVTPATRVLEGPCGTHHSGDVPAPGCYCGCYFVPRAQDFAATQRDWGNPFALGMEGRCEDDWFALSFGAAVGGVEPDAGLDSEWDPPGMVRADAIRRCRRYVTLALVVPDAVTVPASVLADRYDCEVATDMSYRACRALADRLVGSVSAAALAELADRPAVPPISRGRLGGNIDRRPFAACDPVRLAGLMARDPAVRRAVYGG